MTIHVKCEQHPDTIPLINKSAGDLLCPDCGLVLVSSLINDEQDWRSFEKHKEHASIDSTNITSVFSKIEQSNVSNSRKWFVLEKNIQNFLDSQNINPAPVIFQIAKILDFWENLTTDETEVLFRRGRQSRYIYSVDLVVALIYVCTSFCGSPINLRQLFHYFNLDYDKRTKDMTNQKIFKIQDFLRQKKEYFGEMDYKSYMETIFFRLLKTKYYIKKTDVSTSFLLTQIENKFDDLCKNLSIYPKNLHIIKLIMSIVFCLDLKKNIVQKICMWCGANFNSIKIFCKI